MIIAEIGTCDGDLQYGLDLVEAFAPHVDAIKGQFLTADTITHPKAPRYDRTGGPAATQHGLFVGGVSEDGWGQIADAARQAGLLFGASIWNLEDYWPLDFYKIGSGDITYRALVVRLAETAARRAVPLIVSTGACYGYEIERAQTWIRQAGEPETIWLACHLAYPTQDSDAHVARMRSLRLLTGGKVGYSDHTRHGYGAKIAMCDDADVVEVHVTLKSGSHGDHSFACTPSDVTAIRNRPKVGPTTYRGWGNGDLTITEAEARARMLARRGLYAARDIPANTALTADDLIALRPAAGARPVEELESVVGAAVPELLHRLDPIA